jgi:hypothetical protein
MPEPKDLYETGGRTTAFRHFHCGVRRLMVIV